MLVDDVSPLEEDTSNRTAVAMLSRVETNAFSCCAVYAKSPVKKKEKHKIAFYEAVVSRPRKR